MASMKVSDQAHDVIVGWKTDLPVATLMGEFSAGKSTLLNFILGMDVALTRVTATDMPPTWFTYSKKTFAIGLTWEGVEERINLDAADTDFRASYAMIRRGLNSAALKKTDMIDAPGISDPGLQKGALRFLSRYTDFVVWCTAANQAWRQTENAAYDKLSQSIQENSLLVITRMDKLRTQTDRDKVFRRVEKDAGAKFHNVLPLQTTKAASVELGERTDNISGAWVTTGGHGFITAFEDTCSKVVPKRLKKPVIGKVEPKPEPEQKKVKPEASAEDIQAEKFAELRDALNLSLEQLITMPENGPYHHKIDHLIALISCDLPHVKGDNASLLECLRIQSNELDVERAVSQIGREFRAFKDGPKIRIDI